MGNRSSASLVRAGASLICAAFPGTWRARGSLLGGAVLVAVLGAGGCAGSNPTFGVADQGVDMTTDLTPAPADLLVTMCQLVPQAGCPAGLKCTSHDAVTTVCDPNGTNNRGELCTTREGVDSCYAGFGCAAASTKIGICRAYCRTDANCGNRSYCELPLGTSGIYLCTEPCNPFGAGCAAGLDCFAYDQEHTDCRIAGTKGEGQACARPEDCQKGMACLGPAGGEACRFLCLRASPSCPNLKSCYTIQGPRGTWPTYGACL